MWASRKTSKPHLLQIPCDDKAEFREFRPSIYLIRLPVKVKKLAIQKYPSIKGGLEIMKYGYTHLHQIICNLRLSCLSLKLRIKG